MYWVDQGRHVVERASMDGTSRSILHNSTGLISPVALTLDMDTQTLYWIDNKQHQLESSSVNGSNRRIVIRSIQSPLSDPTYGLDIFLDAIYWTNSVTKQLYSTNLDKILIESIKHFPVTDGLYEIAIVAPSKQPLGKYLITGSGCSLPKVVGPCRAAFPRWFFNIKTRRCERFIYGGCEGNANNFNSLAECLNTCHVIMVSIANPCDDNNGGCSQLCLISSNSSTGYGCACSTGQHLAADGRGCLGEYDTTIMLL